MAGFSLDSGVVTIGAGAAAGVNTWGDPIRVPDAGVPVSSLVNFGPVNPQKMWKTQPSLRKVVEFAARNVATVPWKGFQRVDDTDRQRIADSAAETVLRRPRPRVTDFALKFRLAVDFMLYDRWCVALIDGQLQRIPPRSLIIESDALDNITLIGVSVPGGVVDLTGVPLAFGTGWSAWGGDGVSPLVTLSQILQEQTNAVAWRNAKWGNAPKFSGIITRPADAPSWEGAKRDRFVQSWRDYRDQKAGGTPIFEDGMDYKDLSDTVNPVDAQDIEGRRLTDAEVASAFHIPPELVGARQGNFSNIAAFRQMLFGPTLGPLLEQFQQAFNLEIVPALDPRPGVYVELDREAAMNGSFLEQIQYMQTATGGPVLLRSEGRAKMNLPFIEGTDELIVPLNVTEGGLASPTDTGSQNLRGRQLRKAARQFALRGLHTAKGKAQDSLADTLGKIYERQLEQVEGSVDEAEFHDKWDQIMEDAVHPHLWASALAGARSVLQEYNPEGDGWAQDAMRGYVAAMARGQAQKINAGVITAINDEPDDDDEQAEGGTSLLDRLRDSTAVAWAGALVADAAGFGRQDAATASGLAQKTWVVTSQNPRPSHAAMNGESVGLDEVFSNGARWPGDGGLDVDESAGCTCELEYTW